MKAIGVKLVDLEPMTAKEAAEHGYRVNRQPENAPGYEVTYDNGYKSWSPKDVVESAYLMLQPENDGNIVMRTDVDAFIVGCESMKLGEKTTVVNAHTRTGFDLIAHSSCVSPEKYNHKLGTQYAMERVANKLWGHLGFVLQWAKNGLKPMSNNTNE